jgi:hypothetical protein
MMVPLAFWPFLPIGVATALFAFVPVVMVMMSPPRKHHVGEKSESEKPNPIIV